jgi:hypothetical protein
MNQLTLNVAAVLRDVGIQQATDHAEHASPGWTDIALAYTKTWCLNHAEIFTGEDIVDLYAVRDDLVQPVQSKAWGTVMRMAVKRGYMKIKDREGRRRKGHCSPCPRYESLIVGKRATELT